MRKYVHLSESAFNCAKYPLHKDICITVNIQLSFKTFINVSQNSNSSNNFHLRHCKFNNIKRTFFCVIEHALLDHDIKIHEHFVKPAQVPLLS